MGVVDELGVVAEVSVVAKLGVTEDALLVGLGVGLVVGRSLLAGVHLLLALVPPVLLFTHANATVVAWEPFLGVYFPIPSDFPKCHYPQSKAATSTPNQGSLFLATRQFSGFPA